MSPLIEGGALIVQVGSDAFTFFFFGFHNRDGAFFLFIQFSDSQLCFITDTAGYFNGPKPNC